MSDIQTVPIDSLEPHPRNPRVGSVDAIRQSIRANGWHGVVVVQRSTGRIVVGHHRWLAAKAEGLTELPVEFQDLTDEEAVRKLLADNQSSDVAGYADDRLAELLSELRSGAGLAGSGYDDATLDRLLADMQPPPPPDPRAGLGSLAARFVVPPFSVLDARQGYWQDRKRAWLSLGIRSEEGRPRNLLKMSDTVNEAMQPKAPNGSSPSRQHGRGRTQAAVDAAQ